MYKSAHYVWNFAFSVKKFLSPENFTLTPLVALATNIRYASQVWLILILVRKYVILQSMKMVGRWMEPTESLVLCSKSFFSSSIFQIICLQRSWQLWYFHFSFLQRSQLKKWSQNHSLHDSLKPMFKNFCCRFCILLGAIWRYNLQYNPQHKCSKTRGGGEGQRVFEQC